MPATLGLSKRSPRRFLEVGNGKETPEKTQISRFYTAWAKSGHLRQPIDKVKTMRSPSRLVPPRSENSVSWVWLLGALLVGFGYFFYSLSNVARCITAFLILAFCGYVIVINKREKRRFEAMSSIRDEESICTFARSFSTRHVDTWVIRAAHQEIQRLMKSYVPAFPVRASDVLLDDLHIDSDDIEDLLVDIAARSGHSLDETENNPFYGKVDTVRDLVLFINAQPRLATVRPSA